MQSISLLSTRALFAKVFLATINGLLLCIGFSSLFPAQIVSADTSAYVRIIHASPFVGSADVFVDGKVLLTSFEFASITDYVPLPPGPHKIQISLVGKGINAAALTQSLTVEEGHVYTIAALGTSAGHLSLQAFEDDNHLDPSHARVRIYQLSPDAGSVDVSVCEGNKVTGMSYPAASEYLDTNTGQCTFALTNPHSSLAPLTTTVDTQAVTSLFVVGMFNGTPKAQLVYKQSQSIPGLPNTGNDPSPLADSVNPLPLLSLLLVGCTLVVSLIALRRWRIKRIGTV